MNPTSPPAPVLPSAASSHPQLPRKPPTYLKDYVFFKLSLILRSLIINLILLFATTSFHSKFKWDAEHAQVVFMEFKRKCMKRLTDTAYKAAKRPADHLPSWLSPKDKFQEVRTLQEDGEGSQESEHSPPSETELFLEATGGFLPSGTILGLGTATQLFYEKPIRGKSISVSSTSSRAVSDLKEQIEIQARLLEEANKRAETDRAAHAKELEETKKEMETKLEGNLREMEDLKRMVREMMVNLTPSMSCNPFTGLEMQPPS